jgi:serine/threonine protein kinase
MSAESTSTEFGNELPIGYRLEEFEIKSVLGSGGFGITYLAADVDLKRDVVVKENLPFQCAMRDSTRSVRPRTSTAGDRTQFDWALQSFLREAETLSRFDHPNIVRILRRFEANNTAYFVMPYLPGKSLKQVIDEQVAREQGFTEQRLKELLHPLLDALETLHNEGVYHRDIKAANILLATGHRPILIDFGAARQVISEKSHTVVESAGYTPFEQLQSHGNVGPWSDIYALGGTFYTAIHGEPPPRASDRVRRDPIIRLADQYEGTYSRAFLEALDWALKFDETERPQNVAEWRAALQSGVMPARLVSPPREGHDITPPPAISTGRGGAAPPTLPVVPKKKDAAPFPFALVGKIVGGALGGLLLLLLAWHLLQPFLATPGSLVVAADPPSATVKISGQHAQPVPAQFPKLRIGRYQVTVSSPGYDSITRTVEIREGQPYPWAPVQLQRAFGTLSLSGVPIHASYHLQASPEAGGKDYHGSLPATLSNLPAGSYQLTLAAGDLRSATLPIEVAPHQTTASQQDLVKLGVSQGADPDAARALLGQTQPAQLSDPARQAYRDLARHSIDDYIHYNLFPQAAAQIDELKKLGDNTQPQETALDQARQTYEKTSEDQIRSLIADGRDGAARARLAAVGDALGPDAANRLTGEFQGQLSDYEQDEKQALLAAQNGDPAQAYPQLSAFVARYPDDVDAQLALTDLSRRMPPEHARLAAELASFRAIPMQDVGADQAAKIQDDQSRVQTELSTYDTLQAQVNQSKDGPGHYSSRIAALQENIDENQRKLAVGDGVNSAVNSVTSLFGAHVRVISAEDRREAISRDQSQIAQLQAEQQNSQAGTNSAQQDFDAFCQKVPW